MARASKTTPPKGRSRGEKMTEDGLLDLLQTYEDDAAQYTFGTLRQQRDRAIKEYFQRPYGNEEEGWSQYVSSELMDTIEWLLPDLIDLFVSSEDAVTFDPTRADQVEGAQQQTDTCNYVFYKQNNGFMVLYTAFKDALQVRNCAVHWRVHTARKKVYANIKGTLAEVNAAMEDEDEVEAADIQGQQPAVDELGYPVLNAFGQPTLEPVWSVRVSRIERRKTVRVEAFEPENLLIARQWTSPLLEECPYVCRPMEISLSDLWEMGFTDVTAEDLAGSDEPAGQGPDPTRRYQRDPAMAEEYRPRTEGVDVLDPSQTMGVIRIEWVLADFDGDGIAERREIIRLEDRILSNEECSQVPIATGSPMLVQHRWDGMGYADIVGNLQLLKTELTRGVINNAHAANNPRKTVLYDRNGEVPYADINALLDGRPGGTVPIYSQGAIQYENTPYVGNQMQPLLEYVDGLTEKRTGVTKQRMGIDPDAIRPDRTLGETKILDTASKQRVKLIGRILGETIVKPMFQGIRGLLADGGLDEKIAFKLRGKFVEVDPNDWDTGYDMTVNVGLGTGDRDLKAMVLANVQHTQVMLAQSPLAPMLIKPKQIYNALVDTLDYAGFKDKDRYYSDPGEAPIPQPPPAPPPYQLLVEQMKQKGETERQGMQLTYSAKEKQYLDQIEQRRLAAQDEVQARNDDRDAEREQAVKALDAQLETIKAQLDMVKNERDNLTRLAIARISHPEGEMVARDILDPITGEATQSADPANVRASLEALLAQQEASPTIIRHPVTQEIIGVEKGGKVSRVVRDEAGQVSGLAPHEPDQSQTLQ